MAITKLVLDRQAAGRVFTFGSAAASADVNLAKATGDSADVVVLNAEGSIATAGNIEAQGTLIVSGLTTLEGGLDVDGNVIANVAGPTNGSDAANKTYVDGEVSTLSGDIASISGSIATEINAIQSDIASSQSDIITLDGRLDTAELSLSTAEFNIATAQNDIISLDGRLDTAESDIDSLEGRMNTAESDIDALQSDVATLQSDLNDYALLDGGNNFTGDQQITGNLIVNGDISVTGTQTIINSTTVEIGDNIIALNGTGAAFGGIEVNDPTAPNTLSGSLLWDSTADTWIAGPKGSELPVLTATAGNNGQILTSVDGAALFVDVISFKRVSISGTKNGSNKNFGMDISDAFVAGSEQVILNGIILMPGSGNDYTVDGKTIVFEAAFPAPLADDNLQIFASH